MPRSSATRSGAVDGVDQVPGGEVEVDRARHLARRLVGAARRRRRDSRAAAACSPARPGGRSRCRRRARRGWRGCRPCARPAARRRGPTRTSEKSEVPPPMSATSTISSRAHRAARSRTRRRSARTGTRPREAGALRGRRAARAAACASRAGSSSTKNTGRPSTAPADRVAGLGLGPPPQVRQVAGDDVEVADGAAAADVGGLLDQAELPRMLFIERISRPSMPST